MIEHGCSDDAALTTSQVQKGTPMGISIHWYFGALAIAQLGTIGILGLTYWEQRQLQIQLRELSEDSWFQRGSGLKVARNSGFPGGPTPPGRTTLGSEPPQSPEVGQFSIKQQGEGLSQFGLGGLLLILISVLILVFTFGWWCLKREQKRIAEVEIGSPINQRQLAQRQLAELRLRRHVFGR